MTSEIGELSAKATYYTNRVKNATKITDIYVARAKREVLTLIETLKSQITPRTRANLTVAHDGEVVLERTTLRGLYLTPSSGIKRLRIKGGVVLYNITLVGIPVIVEGSNNLLVNVKVDGLGRTDCIVVSGNNNTLFNVTVMNCITGIYIYHGHNNIVWNFNITRASRLLLGVEAGNNNIVANGYGIGPYPTFGILIWRGKENVVYNVTIASAHNNFLFNVDGGRLYLVNTKCLRAPGLTSDDYYEGAVRNDGEVYIINPVAIGSATEVIGACGNGSVYVVNPHFRNNMGLFLFFSCGTQRLNVIVINGSASTAETRTWYRSLVPRGVKLVLLNTTVTPIDFTLKGGQIETLPYPLPLALVVSSLRVYNKLMLLVAVPLFLTLVVRLLVRRHK